MKPKEEKANPTPVEPFVKPREISDLKTSQENTKTLVVKSQSNKIARVGV